MITLLLTWLSLAGCTSLPGSECLDLDDDGYATCRDKGEQDCDDTRWDVHPGSAEVCDGVDSDCDGLLGVLEHDLDQDGALACAEDCDDSSASLHVRDDDLDGYSPCAGDCADDNPSLFPGAQERCDLVDNDCDGQVDDGHPVFPWYADADLDTWGDDASVQWGCRPPFTGAVPRGGDCQDDVQAVHPEAAEWCNGIDDDCDGITDGPTSLDAALFYADGDADGYGDLARVQRACEAPPGWVSDSTDCDDADPARHPGLPEVCDDRDNDCDGAVDDSAIDQGTWHADGDGDGYGDPATSVMACDPPPGWLADGSDCDDGEARRFPGNPEICDHLDNDCDGVVDDAAAGQQWYYPDLDGDGWGDTPGIKSCDRPTGYVDRFGDCDDGEPSAFPGGTEICGTGIDEDCFGGDEPCCGDGVCASGETAESCCEDCRTAGRVYAYLDDPDCGSDPLYIGEDCAICTQGSGACSTVHTLHQGEEILLEVLGVGECFSFSTIHSDATDLDGCFYFDYPSRTVEEKTFCFEVPSCQGSTCQNLDRCTYPEHHEPHTCPDGWTP